MGRLLRQDSGLLGEPPPYLFLACFLYRGGFQVQGWPLSDLLITLGLDGAEVGVRVQAASYCAQVDKDWRRTGAGPDTCQDKKKGGGDDP